MQLRAPRLCSQSVAPTATRRYLFSVQGHSFGGLVAQQVLTRPPPSGPVPLIGVALLASVPPQGNAPMVARFMRTKPIASLKARAGLADGKAKHLRQLLELPATVSRHERSAAELGSPAAAAESPRILSTSGQVTYSFISRAFERDEGTCRETFFSKDMPSAVVRKCALGRTLSDARRDIHTLE